MVRLGQILTFVFFRHHRRYYFARNASWRGPADVERAVRLGRLLRGTVLRLGSHAGRQEMAQHSGRLGLTTAP